MQLTELGRRVLGHLPVWAEDEDAHIEAEGGPDRIDEETGLRVGSIRSYPLDEFTERLAEDPFTGMAVDGGEEDELRPLTEAEVAVSLENLVSAGLAEQEENGHYRMSQAGLEALVAPEHKPDQVPGAVVVDLAPAHIDSAAIGG